MYNWKMSSDQVFSILRLLSKPSPVMSVKPLLMFQQDVPSEPLWSSANYLLYPIAIENR